MSERVYDFEDVPSMGCHIPSNPCSVCGGDHSVQESKVFNDGTVPAGGDFEFFSVSWVSAPKCDVCHTEMEVASDYEWKCPNGDCRMHGVQSNTGIMPFSQIKQVEP